MLLQEYLQGYKIVLLIYMVVVIYGVVYNQQFEVECMVLKFDVKVLGFGVSWCVVEQVVVKKVFDEVMVVVLMLVVKLKCLKNVCGFKYVEFEIVLGVKGVQEVFDLCLFEWKECVVVCEVRVVGVVLGVVVVVVVVGVELVVVLMVVIWVVYVELVVDKGEWVVKLVIDKVVDKLVEWFDKVVEKFVEVVLCVVDKLVGQVIDLVFLLVDKFFVDFVVCMFVCVCDVVVFDVDMLFGGVSFVVVQVCVVDVDY